MAFTVMNVDTYEVYDDPDWFKWSVNADFYKYNVLESRTELGIHKCNEDDYKYFNTVRKSSEEIMKKLK